MRGWIEFSAYLSSVRGLSKLENRAWGVKKSSENFFGITMLPYAPGKGGFNDWNRLPIGWLWDGLSERSRVLPPQLYNYAAKVLLYCIFLASILSANLFFSQDPVVSLDLLMLYLLYVSGTTAPTNWVHYLARINIPKLKKGRQIRVAPSAQATTTPPVEQQPCCSYTQVTPKAPSTVPPATGASSTLSGRIPKRPIAAATSSSKVVPPNPTSSSTVEKESQRQRTIAMKFLRKTDPTSWRRALKRETRKRKRMDWRAMTIPEKRLKLEKAVPANFQELAFNIEQNHNQGPRSGLVDQLRSTAWLPGDESELASNSSDFGEAGDRLTTIATLYHRVSTQTFGQKKNALGPLFGNEEKSLLLHQKNNAQHFFF